MTAITIVNRSGTLNDPEISAVISALQAWVTEDVCPAWSLDPPILSFTATGVDPDPAALPIWIMDHSDTPGALGYHEDSQGRIDGKVFVGDCLSDGVEWTVDLAHELAEMICDPEANAIVTLPDSRQTVREVCDPVEDDQFAYEKNGVKVSDFVLPSYFSQGPSPWDYRSHLAGAAPAMVAGGYISIYDGSAWTQVFAMRADGSISDRAKRRGRSAWRVARNLP